MTFDKKYMSCMNNIISESSIHYKYASMCKRGIIKIGILFGETSRILCKAAPTIHVYGIDPLIPDSMNPDLIGNISIIKNNVGRYSNFIFINDYSYNQVTEWNKPFDYIFIDGSHKYEDVKSDFESWFLLIDKKGIIAIHDSTANRGGPYWWPGPSKLADELISDDRVEFLESVGTLSVFRKNI